MQIFVSPCTAIFHSACFGSAGRTAEHSCFAHIEIKQWKWKASSIPNRERPLWKCPSGFDSTLSRAWLGYPRNTSWQSPLEQAQLCQPSASFPFSAQQPPCCCWCIAGWHRGLQPGCESPPMPTEKGVSRLYASVTEHNARPLRTSKYIKL